MDFEFLKNDTYNEFKCTQFYLIDQYKIIIYINIHIVKEIC